MKKFDVTRVIDIFWEKVIANDKSHRDELNYIKVSLCYSISSFDLISIVKSTFNLTFLVACRDVSV